MRQAAMPCQAVYEHLALNDSGFFQKSEMFLKTENLTQVEVFKEFTSGSENNSKRSLKILLSKSSITRESIYHSQGDTLKEKNSLGSVNSSSILFHPFSFLSLPSLFFESVTPQSSKYLIEYHMKELDQELQNQFPSKFSINKHLKFSGSMITGICGDHREKTLPAWSTHNQLYSKQCAEQ